MPFSLLLFLRAESFCPEIFSITSYRQRSPVHRNQDSASCRPQPFQGPRVGMSVGVILPAGNQGKGRGSRCQPCFGAGRVGTVMTGLQNIAVHSGSRFQDFCFPLFSQIPCQQHGEFIVCNVKRHRSSIGIRVFLSRHRIKTMQFRGAVLQRHTSADDSDFYAGGSCKIGQLLAFFFF